MNFYTFYFTTMYKEYCKHLSKYSFCYNKKKEENLCIREEYDGGVKRKDHFLPHFTLQ